MPIVKHAHNKWFQFIPGFAAFISSRQKEIESVFEQVLLICHEQGLLGNEMFAIDGCKMSSNAAKECSGTFKELEEKRNKLKRQIQYHMSEHKRLDKSEAADEVRKQRAEQAKATLNKAHDKIDNFLKTASPRKGKANEARKSKVTLPIINSVTTTLSSLTKKKSIRVNVPESLKSTPSQRANLGLTL